MLPVRQPSSAEQLHDGTRAKGIGLRSTGSHAVMGYLHVTHWQLYLHVSAIACCRCVTTGTTWQVVKSLTVKAEPCNWFWHISTAARMSSRCHRLAVEEIIKTHTAALTLYRAILMMHFGLNSDIPGFHATIPAVSG